MRTKIRGLRDRIWGIHGVGRVTGIVVVVVSLRKVVHLHSIRSADWHRVMANRVLVVGIHGRLRH
jgi:hypothetical protein